MTSFYAMIRTTAFLILATASLALPACKSNNSSSATSTGPLATFVADDPPMQIALLPGSSSGASVDVRVGVTGVTGFFGAAFRIEYDPATLSFTGMDDSDSFLRRGFVTDDHLFFLADDTSIPGEILITATRIDPTVAPPIDISMTSDLVVLNFTALQAIAATAPSKLVFGASKQVCDGTVAAPGCHAISVTWSGGGVSAQ